MTLNILKCRVFNYGLRQLKELSIYSIPKSYLSTSAITMNCKVQNHSEINKIINFIIHINHNHINHQLIFIQKY